MKNLSKANPGNPVVYGSIVLLKIVFGFRLARIRVGKTGFPFWASGLWPLAFFCRKATGYKFLPGGKNTVFEDRKQIFLVES